ncbi:nucleotidyltransferase domain-containing protein [Candidatus Aerophobetes bacterium]|nr:nucleotidyltransferase domain-containing protein [Candidatus Aerophobetes bacterium]
MHFDLHVELKQKKERVLSWFTQELLKSQVKEQVARVFLFGSLLREDIDEGSDIDVLIFATGELDKVRQICADISFEAALKFGESVEPLVYCVDEMRYFPSSFIFSVVSRGKEIYKMEEKRDRKTNQIGVRFKK